MSDIQEEIKEILDKLKKLCYDDYCLEFSVDYIERKEEKLLLDYMTNLQTIEREYSAVLSENAELQEENERLNLIIRAIKKQCEVCEDYEMSEFIKQLENEKEISNWLKRVAGVDEE